MKCFVLTKRKAILALSVAVCVAAGIVFGIHGAAANAAATKTRLVPIYNVKTDQKKISISFDAAWGNEQTQNLIDILGKYSVKTTFFVVGSWVEKYPESVKALADAGLAFDPKLVRQADFDSHSGYKQMQSLLETNPDFTAVFVASDAVAIGAMLAIREAGLSIPDDISIVGFDDIPAASYVTPKLSTVHMPAKEIAQHSCELLLQLMRGEKPATKDISLPTHLKIRESTAYLERRP